MNTYIYGAGNNGGIVLKLIREIYDTNIKICGFIDKEKRGLIEGVPIYSIDSIEVENIQVIIAIGIFDIAVEVWKYLKEKGCKQIYWFQGERIVFHRDFYEEQCVSCEGWGEEMLKHVEMHVMDACNLNCRGCTHFSPIFNYEVPERKDRINDVRRLSKKVSHIVRFYLLGGEPFLNPEISDYVKEVREVLPYSEIYIVTNGLLIPKVNDMTLRTIKEERVKISISEYKPTHENIEEIKKRLDEYEIIYEIRDWPTKLNFNLPLVLNTDNDYPKLCISNGCVNIWNGKISRCPTLMYIDRFNEYFGTQLPNDGIMQLEECPSGKELVDALKKNVALCEHCIKNEIEWSICGKKAELHDFAVEK